MVPIPHSPPKTRRQSKSYDDAQNRSFDTELLTAAIKSALRLDPKNSGDRDLLVSRIHRYFAQYGEDPETNLDYYIVGEVIGKGDFGRVVRATHKLTGLNVAIKIIDRDLLKSDKWKLKVSQEVHNLRVVHHPNVVRLLELFHSQHNCLIVTDYTGGGNLLQYIKAKVRLSEGEAKAIFKQVVEGTVAIHDNGILHRDLKLDNLLLDSDLSYVKISDFGVSKRVKKGQKSMEQCGTPAYLAPEMVLDKGYDGFGVDVWSLGVVLYAMVTGTVPFRAHSIVELHKTILRGNYLLPDYLSPEVKDLLKQFLQVLPQKRISLSHALQHPWFSSMTPSDKRLSMFRPVRTKAKTGSLGIDEFVLSQVEAFGYPRNYIVSSLTSHLLNHATASYYLLLSNLK